jgi:SOS-response transcriptional repressors (RecA-mediated autopeptidases)
MSLGDRISSLRALNGMKSEELAEKAGVPIGTLNKILNGETKNPTGKTLAGIASALNCTVEYLYVDDAPIIYANIRPARRKRIPIIGKIAAGVPIFAERDYERYALADDDITCDFALEVEGDSMIDARINNGDIVFIREQPTVNNGEIAAVVIDDTVTLKRVYKTKNGIQLVSANPKYDPMYFTNENSDYISILGKAVAFQSNL